MIACRASLILMSKRERDFSRALISRRRVLSNLLLICCFSQFDPFCKPHVLGSFKPKNLTLQFHSRFSNVAFNIDLAGKPPNLRKSAQTQTKRTSFIDCPMVRIQSPLHQILNENGGILVLVRDFEKSTWRILSWTPRHFWELKILILFSLHQKSFQNRFKSPVPDYNIHFWCHHCSY